MRLFRRRFHAEVAQQFAGRGLAECDLFDFTQAGAVIGSDGAVADALKQGFAGGLFLGFGPLRGQRGGDFLRVAPGDSGGGRTGEIGAIGQRLHGGPRGSGGIAAVSQFDKLSERKRFALGQFEDLGEIRLFRSGGRQRRDRPRMDHFNIFGADAFGGTAFDADVDLVFVDRGDHGGFAVIEGERAGIQMLHRIDLFL